MPRRNLFRFCAWTATAVLLAGLVPVGAVLGASGADSTRVHLAVACLLPVAAGMALRSAAAVVAADRTY